MNAPTRIYLSLSPRIRKALDLCVALDGSPAASYAANILSTALMHEIGKSPALQERWTKLERDALQRGSWDFSSLDGIAAPVTSTPLELLERKLFLVGSHPQHYLHGVTVESTQPLKKSVFLRSNEQGGEGFATLMLKIDAEPYAGKRIQFSALVKAEEIEGWSGLWMRIDGPQVDSLDHDNMQDRPIQGTVDWQRYQVVLDVPEESLDIAFGLLLQGRGQVWLQDASIIEVEEEIAVTSHKEQKVSN
ncbi:hypothetical protein KDA_49400 [Dictyobacter alpinus]|uniref:Uncharacterized protein n=1 Tax=Dictyobacter alpinus TaxID=2014873 RepID=A0A402BDS3_9CHLR|nr:hypothetical protein [Dictyobacter alpinus]GCE29456.1 hypothetical protein KDA_49400 [Dictyobacter alpinus]